MISAGNARVETAPPVCGDESRGVLVIASATDPVWRGSAWVEVDTGRGARSERWSVARWREFVAQ